MCITDESGLSMLLGEHGDELLSYELANVMVADMSESLGRM